MHVYEYSCSSSLYMPVSVHVLLLVTYSRCVGQVVGSIHMRDDSDVQVLIMAVRSLTDWSSVPSSFHPVIL